jgi:RimJ/RimL family protein N-acetyltransferase
VTQSPFVSSLRCDLLPLTKEDLTLYLRLFSDPTVMAHLGGPVERKLIEDRHRKALDHWQQHGFGTSVISLRKTGEKIGIASLFWTQVEGEKVLERGVALLPSHQGMGIWPEVANSLMDYIRQNIPATALVAFPDISNNSSNAILAKSGFKKMGVVEYPYLGGTLKSAYWRYELAKPNPKK